MNSFFHEYVEKEDLGEGFYIRVDCGYYNVLLRVFHIIKVITYPNAFLTKLFFIKEIMNVIHSFGTNWVHIVSKGP